MTGGGLFLIAAAVVFRESAAALSASRPQILYPLVSSLDSLLLGALAAYCVRRDQPSDRAVVRFLHVGGVYVFLPLLVLSKAIAVVFHVTLINDVTQGQLLIALASAGVVLHYAMKRNKALISSRWLSHPLLSYLGVISYGMYVYHFPWDRMFYERVLVRAYGFADDFWMHFFVVLTLTVLTASLSWHLIESPLLKFKSRFPYTDQN